MKLELLLEGLDYSCVNDISQVTVNDICFDSRKVKLNDMFVANKGYNVDGHDYIEKATELGASVILCEHKPKRLAKNVKYIVTPDSSLGLGVVSSNFYDNPSRKLKLIGVTGTNGKTTTVTLLYEMLNLFGKKAGLISTVCNYIDTLKVASHQTTPDPITINKLLSSMVVAGCEYCFMEVSSHSAHQQRIAGLDFDGAVFSNITHDHLDYHKTFKAYINAKKIFFDKLKAQAFSLVNVDDKNGEIMFQNTRAKKYTYSCKKMADFNCKVRERHLNSTLLSIDNNEVWTKFTGDFNAYNVLAVYSTAILLGFTKDEVLKNISLLVPVSGRFETMISKTGITVVVDYAHTPDAVENVLKSLNELKTNNKIISVVGAGGDRDKTKRPEMAEVASRMSDMVVLTSDNPRTEDPDQIIRDMLVGVPDAYKTEVLCITDRAKAIKTAIVKAKKGDVVLVAGKGHEDYQEIMGVKHHFDDKEVVNDFFKQL